MKHLLRRTGVLICTVFFCGCATELKPSAFGRYQTKTDLIFPLTGESLIGTGGRTITQNPDHIYGKDQRFAIDVVALAPGSPAPALEGLVDRVLSGQLAVFQGSGDDYNTNANHYCFGRLVVAPGDGVIADSRDGIFDNIPGHRNDKGLAGNYVVIDHLNGEFSMLAHFQKGSVLVSEGDSVRAGEPIGKCGNSGRSNLPHLHYHLQNSALWLVGDALPAQFNDYFANGSLVHRGEPIQGEIISQNTEILE